MAISRSLRHLLDTCILIHYARGSVVAEHIENRFNFRSTTIPPLICEVTVGELYSFALCRKWGTHQKKELQKIIDLCMVVPLNLSGVHQAYAELDYFSLNPGRGFSARSMGKNDLWIAAVTRVTGAMLLTNDHDFDHFSPDWLQLEYIDPALGKTPTET